MEESVELLVDEIRRALKENLDPCYHNTANTEVYVRCPNCGDSQKNRRGAHLYIKMAPPFSFYCQKCGFHGVLNGDVLGKLGIYDNDLLLRIREANKGRGINNNVRTAKPGDQIIDYKDSDTDCAKASLDYFNSRFGVEETAETLNDRFKAILDPAAFLRKLRKTNLNSRFDFSRSIGFVSSDGKYMICRDNSGQQELRYSNVALSDDENKSKIYNIKTPVNLMQDEITLAIAEGIFDAIGLYYKRFKDSQNVIVAAACGKSYEQVIDTYLRKGFLNLSIEIYSDQDVGIQFYRDMRRKSKIIAANKMSVFYNAKGKDCGVPADQIELRRASL